MELEKVPYRKNQAPAFVGQLMSVPEINTMVHEQAPPLASTMEEIASVIKIYKPLTEAQLEHLWSEMDRDERDTIDSITDSENEEELSSVEMAEARQLRE